MRGIVFPNPYEMRRGGAGYQVVHSGPGDEDVREFRGARAAKSELRRLQEAEIMQQRRDQIRRRLTGRNPQKRRLRADSVPSAQDVEFAARAQELYGDDELERFAAEKRREQAKFSGKTWHPETGDWRNNPRRRGKDWPGRRWTVSREIDKAVDYFAKTGEWPPDLSASSIRKMKKMGMYIPSEKEYLKSRGLNPRKKRRRVRRARDSKGRFLKGKRRSRRRNPKAYRRPKRARGRRAKKGGKREGGKYRRRDPSAYFQPKRKRGRKTAQRRKKVKRNPKARRRKTWRVGTEHFKEKRIGSMIFTWFGAVKEWGVQEAAKKWKRGKPVKRRGRRGRRRR